MRSLRFAPYILLALCFFTLGACDKSKNTFMNRKYQDMVARFNVYFNGTERLRKATEALQAGHADDYSEVLEMYNYGTTENKKAKAGEMDEIIKKSSKIIADRPLSKWVDDAYLLMGKAYYYKGDYFAAIETFQYINSKYKGEEISYEATLWIIRAYIRLDKEREAEAIIGLMNNDAAFPEDLKHDLTEVSAAVYIKEGKYQSAADNLKKLLENKRVRPNAKRARYRYILGQLYDRLGNREEARKYFELVTKGSPPYEMAFNAKINLARNYDPSNEGEVRQAKRYLKSMLRDDKNISYFDQIYYELGIIEKAEDDKEEALEYLRLSNNYNKSNRDQRALAFLAMADIYFDIPDYKQAQVYYDSAVFFLDPKFENYDQLKAKQEVLSELIKSLIVIHREDSLLKLSYLDPKELDKRIEEAIAAEKERERKRKEAEEERKRNQMPGNNPMIPGNPFQQQQQQSQAMAGSGFYFDDPTNVARGYSEFLNRWGRRNNVDNWQFASAAREEEAAQEANKGDETDNSGEDQVNEQEEVDNGLPDSIAPEKALYYKDIPFSKDARKNSLNRIAQAYIDAGVIYYEQLKELKEAQQKFSTFLERFPKNEQVPQALYYLYKIYADEGNAQLADKHKSTLISQHTESKYARFLTQTGEPQESTDPAADKAVTDLYKKAYKAFKDDNYAEMFRQKKLHDEKYFGSQLQPKFELLKAMSYSKMDSMESTITNLEALVRNYPTAAEALVAQRMLNVYKRNKSQSEAAAKDTSSAASGSSVSYVYQPEGTHYFLLLLPPVKGKLNVNLVKARFSDFNKTNASDRTYAVDDIAVGDRQFILVKQFPNSTEALNYLSLVESNKEFLASLGIPDYELFVMDAKNVGLMVVNSDLEGFSKFYREYYRK